MAGALWHSQFGSGALRFGMHGNARYGQLSYGLARFGKAGMARRVEVSHRMSLLVLAWYGRQGEFGSGGVSRVKARQGVAGLERRALLCRG